MTSLPESRIDTKDWSGWAGTAADLERLFKSVEKQYTALIPDHIEKELQHPRTMLDMEVDRGERLRKDAERYGEDSAIAARLTDHEAELKKYQEAVEVAEARAQKAGNIKLSLSGLNGDRTTVEGSAAELIEYIDGKRFKSFVASAPSGDIRARSIMIGADKKDGIDLRVSSDDATWGRAAFSAISEEIKNQVPAWRWIRNQVVLWFFYSLVNLGLLILVGALFPKIPSGPETTIIGTICCTITLVAGMTLTRRYVPAFELVATSAQPRGVSFLKFWGYTVGIGLVVGFVGNGISKAILG